MQQLNKKNKYIQHLTQHKHQTSSVGNKIIWLRIQKDNNFIDWQHTRQVKISP